MRPFRDRDWDRLIAQVVAGNVIPVLGAEIVLIPEADGTFTPVEQYLSRGLASYFGDGTPAPVTLRRFCSDVVSRPGVHQDDCHFQASDILGRVAADSSGPLSLLADITDLTLFVSTTPDDFLRQALVASRGASPAEFVYSPQRRLADLPEQDRPGTFLYKLFGTASSGRDFVLTEEDFLVFVRRLQQPDYQPIRLLERLRSSTLLLLGSSFPDWLARFFFYSAQGEPLLNGRSRAIVADRLTAKDEGLVAFLERSGAQVWPDGDGAAFVSELHRRWSERQRTRSAQTTAAPGPNAEAPKDALFISYASEDLAAATRVAEALRAKGLPVWFDKQRLESGDDYRDRIRQNIDGASFFLPLLSQHTQVEQPRFFRREWTWALDQREARLGMDYIIPIVLDAGVRYDDALIPAHFREKHWEPAPGGELSATFLDSIQRRFRSYRSGRAGGRANG